MKKYFRLLGNALMILSIIFLGFRVRNMDISWGGLLEANHLIAIVLCIALYSLLILISYYPWMTLVGLITGRRNTFGGSRTEFLRVFTKSNIMKYIPGNVFQYVGRNEIATVLGLPHIQVAAATVVEMVLMASGAGALSVLLLGSYTFRYFYSRLGAYLYLIAMICLLAAAVLWLLFRGRLNTFFTNNLPGVRKESFLPGIAFCFFFYIMAFFYGGALFIAVLKVCGTVKLNPQSLKLLMGTYSLSWMAGYITPGAPGGMGIREVIMTAVLGGNRFIADDVIIQASILFRLVTLLGDLIAFLIAQLIFGIRR